MGTITLNYDTHNALAKKILDFILSLGIFEEKKKKNRLEQAFEDIEKGRVYKISNLDELYEECLK